MNLPSGLLERTDKAANEVGTILVMVRSRGLPEAEIDRITRELCRGAVDGLRASLAADIADFATELFFAKLRDLLATAFAEDAPAGSPQ